MSHTIYQNFALEDKIESSLTTKLDLSQFLTVNPKLAAEPGMKIKILKRTVSGSAEDLTMGQGNTGVIEVNTVPEDYEVCVTQAKFVYHDEEEMTDPTIVDVGTNGLSDTLANDFVAKAIAEYEKATLVQEYDEDAGITFDDVIDAIAKLDIEAEDGLFLLINPAERAAFRKNLKDELKYVEAFARTGYIGSVSGVPVSVSKAVTAGIAILATKEAVTLFVKKGTEVEQERDADTRTNSVIARKVNTVALTDATKVVLIAPPGTVGGDDDDDELINDPD